MNSTRINTNERRNNAKIVSRALAFCFVLLSIFPLEVGAVAGVPKILSYQGRLLDANGNLLGGAGTDFCFKFSIFDDATVGAPDTKLWPTAAPSTMTISVKQGVFTAGIGDTLAGGDTLNFNFQDNDTVFLNVETASKVGATCAPGDGAEVFENLSPRQRILSSGYTINASTVLGTGQSVMGALAPVSGAVVTIEATTTAAIPLAIRGSSGQTADLFRILNSAGTQLLTFTSGGRLGVGSSSPDQVFSVQGNTLISGNITSVANITATGTLAASGAVTLSSTLGVTGASTLSGGVTITCTGCITDANIASALTGKTYNALTLTSAADGFTIQGGTIARTLTVTAANKTLQGAGTTIDLGGNLTLSGANTLTFTTTGATNVTLPTTGTLSTLAGTEALTNKTIGAGGLTISASANLIHAQGVGTQNLSITAGTGGTTAGLIVKLDTSGQVVTTAITDTNNAVGVAVTTTAAAGVAQIAVQGVVSATADNTVTAGDYIGIGSVTAGRAKSLGATYPSTAGAQVIGRALTGAAVGASFNLMLQGLDNSVSAGGGGGAALSGITAATAANTIANADFAQRWNWQVTTASKAAFTMGENLASSGSNSKILSLETLSGSTAIPLYISHLGQEPFMRLVNAGGIEQFRVDSVGTVFANGFIAKQMQFSEEFVRFRASLVADTAGGGTTGFGDTFAWGVGELGTCTWSMVADSVNGTMRQATSATGSGCLTYLSEAAANRRDVLIAANQPILVLKLKPSVIGANNWVLAGMMDYTDGAVADPTNGIYLSSEGGTTWTGVTKLGAGKSTVVCTGQTVLTTQDAYLRINVTSTLVRFFVDADTSNGIDPVECGTGLSTNIPSTAMTAETMNQARTGGTAAMNLDTDYFRINQDDPIVLESSEASSGPASLSSRADVAEEILAEFPDLIEPGDVLALVGGKRATVARSSRAYEEMLYGVASTDPGLILGEGMEGSVRLALAGRVPVKVNLEGGSILAGDWLTSSSRPGVAMKAKRAGMVIGRALEAYEIEGEGKILASVEVQDWSGLDLTAGNESGGGLLNELILRLRPALASLGFFIENGMARLEKLMTREVVVVRAEIEEADISQARIQSLEVAGKIQLRDQSSGQPYCTWIENGEWVKQPGGCGNDPSASVAGSSVELQWAAPTVEGQPSPPDGSGVPPASQPTTGEVPQQKPLPAEETIFVSAATVAAGTTESAGDQSRAAVTAVPAPQSSRSLQPSAAALEPPSARQPESGSPPPSADEAPQPASGTSSADQEPAPSS